MTPTVQVLLATYNGERFLREQIDSILGQRYASLCILARDDGSGDGTVAILEEYATALPSRFTLLPASAPAGSARGNFALLLAASTAPYVAFADQDDFWLPEKISLEMERMRLLEARHGSETPLLVFTDLRVVDDSLGTLHPSFWEHEGIDPAASGKLRRLITQNIVTGCTALLNAPLARLAAAIPEDASMHDWWVALLACTFGQAVGIRQPAVLYRQHSANVLGARSQPKPSGIPKWRYHNERKIQWESSQRQAQALIRAHGPSMKSAQRELLQAYLRCESSPSRIVRIATLLRHGFLIGGVRRQLAILWYLWDMETAKSQPAPENPE